MTYYLGLDGFRWGWVAAWIDDHGNHSFDYSPNLERLLSLRYHRAMIDIPIGLPNKGLRDCDVRARELMGPSVFPGARRELWTFASQASANQYYWLHEGEGMGISCQLWSIRGKIQEVDEIMTPERQRTLCETHPELIFWSRSGRKMLKNKKTDEGRKQRMTVLRRLGFKNIDRWLKLRFRTGIGRDDLIDACACAIAARDADSTFGGPMPDSRGLRMEMHF
jgi:predicted RNase H-like nuclease